MFLLYYLKVMIHYSLISLVMYVTDIHLKL
jgi:hypothetical protein